MRRIVGTRRFDLGELQFRPGAAIPVLLLAFELEEVTPPNHPPLPHPRR